MDDMPKIMIVEDESIVAKDVENMLKSLGYGVAAIASSGKEAIQKAGETNPALVLMDIGLDGDMNGIEAAEQMRVRFGIPVVYLTAYSDADTLQRAKDTEPFGYVLKPFEVGGLHTTVEMALSRYELERKLKRSEQWLATTLKSIGDAVIATDVQGNITFMNPVAEALTGWRQDEALGKKLPEVFNIVNEKTRTPVEDPVAKTLREGVIVDLANQSILIAKSSKEIPIEDSAAPIRDDRGDINGVVLVFHDITERKRAEEELRETNARLSTLIEAVPDLVYFKDTQGRNLVVNKAFEKVVGLEREKILGKTNEQLLPPDLAEQCQRSDEEAMGSREPLRLIEQTVDEDGQKVFFETIKAPLFGDQGNVLGLVGVSRDITERKQAEEEIKRQQRYFQALFEGSPEGVVSLDREFRVVDINPTFEKMFGYTLNDIRGKDLDDYVLPERFAKEGRDLSEKLGNGEVFVIESIRRRKDGKEIPVSILGASILIDDKEEGFFAIYRDITKRKQAEEELTKERSLLRTLIDNLPDYIFVKDTESRFVINNVAHLRVLGANTQDKVIGKTDFDIFPQDLAEQYYADEQGVIRSGQPLLNREEIVTDQAGDRRWLLTTKVPLRDSSGSVVGIVGMSRDITERKRAEETLRISEDKYRKLFEGAQDGIVLADVETGVIIDCNRAAAELVGRKKSELIGTYQRILHPPEKVQGGFSRTFKQHLKEKEGEVLETLVATKKGEIKDVAIRASLFELDGKRIIQGLFRDITQRKRAEEQIKASLKEKEVLLKEIHHRVKNNMQVISSMLNLQSRYVKDDQALDMLRVSQDRVKSMALIHEKLYQSKDLARIDFAEYIENLTSCLFRSYSVNSTNIALETDVDGVSLGINAAIPCGLIINELVSNSLKHAFPAGKKGQICVNLRPENGHYILTVSDDGIGFPKAIDFRNTESLGLQLVNTLTDQLDGTFELHTNGGGTEFRITFAEGE